MLEEEFVDKQVQGDEKGGNETSGGHDGDETEKCGASTVVEPVVVLGCHSKIFVLVFWLVVFTTVVLLLLLLL